jgi:hypothetical protein
MEQGGIPVDIQQLIDYFESLVERSLKLPGGKVVMNHNELDNLIDQLRIAIPQEIHQAKEVLADRAGALSRVQNESQYGLRQSREASPQREDDRASVREVEDKAARVIKAAQDEALRTINGADDYAEESLRQLAQSIIQLNSVIQNGLHALASRRSQRTQKAVTESNVAIEEGALQ